MAASVMTPTMLRMPKNFPSPAGSWAKQYRIGLLDARDGLSLGGLREGHVEIEGGKGDRVSLAVSHTSSPACIS